MRKVICNAGCNEEFILLGFRTKSVQNNIEKVYFQCPHCFMEYIAFYTNSIIRNLQEQQKKLLQRSDPRKLSKSQLKSTETQISNMKKRIKAEMDKLKHEVEGAD